MKSFIAVIVLFFLFTGTAYAGILQVVKEAAGTVASSGSLWAGLATVVILFVFRAIPNKKIYTIISGMFRKFGIVVTLGLSKWKWTAPLWQKIIEPWAIDFIENTVGAAVNGFIEGLRTDNPNGR